MARRRKRKGSKRRFPKRASPKRTSPKRTKRRTAKRRAVKRKRRRSKPKRHRVSFMARNPSSPCSISGCPHRARLICRGKPVCLAHSLSCA